MSTLTPQARQAIRVANREVTLERARQHGTDTTIEMVQCMIDGFADALRDLDGDKGAFDFCARLSDRMARGIRGATVMPEALRKFEAQPQGDIEILPERAPPPQAWSYALVLAAIGFAFLAGFAFRGLGQ